LLLAPTASASTPAPRGHVIVVGLSGLRWSDVSPAATPALWRLAGQGSVGDLVDYAVKPLTCPADGWLTLNAGARAQSEHTNAACGAFPRSPSTAPAPSAGPGRDRALQPAVPQRPALGLLAGSAPIGGNGCTTAVGPGGALALAGSGGHVSSYLPSRRRSPGRCWPAAR